MKASIEKMKNSIVSILESNIVAMYLFGSVAMEDFKLGWSDIDLLCLTAETITDNQAKQLLVLRQTLSDGEKQNMYFRSFEGAIVAWPEFENRVYTKVVYWGTSGQRITCNYCFDTFSEYELIKNGLLLYGTDIRSNLHTPSYEALRKDVIKHYKTIRKYAMETNGSLYSCGWLLDIARGIYTLRTGSVIAKTKAGEWAIEQGLCPVEDEMIQTLKIRNDPMKYKNDKKIQIWLSSLGPSIQQFADVLEAEIERNIPNPKPV